MGRPATCACGTCKKCVHRDYMRAYYQRTKKTYVNPEKRRAYDNNRWHNDTEYRKRHLARMLLSQQVRRGIQTRGPCALCGGESTVGHHNDYDKPLEAVWMCDNCHALIHNALPTF